MNLLNVKRESSNYQSQWLFISYGLTDFVIIDWFKVRERQQTEEPLISAHLVESTSQER